LAGILAIIIFFLTTNGHCKEPLHQWLIISPAEPSATCNYRDTCSDRWTVCGGRGKNGRSRSDTRNDEQQQHKHNPFKMWQLTRTDTSTHTGFRTDGYRGRWRGRSGTTAFVFKL